MRKVLIASTMLFSFGTGLALIPVSFAYAAETGTQAEQAETKAAESEKDWIDVLNTRIDLAQTKVAALKAKIALEIEKSPERARKALDDAESSLITAKNTVSDEGAKRIRILQDDVREAKTTLTAAPDKAYKKVDAVLESTEKQIQSYRDVVLETDEAKVLKKRYAQIQAQAALLKAQLAEKTDQTGEAANAYLAEAKASYAEAKTYALKKEDEAIMAISTRIEETQEAIARKDKQVRAKIAELLEKAKALVTESE